MQATTHLSLVPPQGDIPTGPGTAAHVDPLTQLDRTIAAHLGVDLRLIYGLGVPMLCVMGFITALIISPSYWLVGASLVPELGCLALIMTKLLRMLDEPPDDTEDFAS